MVTDSDSNPDPASRYAHLDFDPEAVQVRAAATVMIVDDRPDLQVLMLKRNARSVFVGDMWVYPGGAVDPEDGHGTVAELCTGEDETSASAALGVERDGLAYWVAALREMFEEAGVLLAHRVGEHGLIDLSAREVEARFSVYRDEVNGGDTRFMNVIAAEQLRLHLTDMHYVGHWVTPMGPPRRYDTRFFLAAMPAGQTPLHDDDEAVHHTWIRPADAVAMNRADEMVMMTPTIAMMKRLLPYQSAAEAVAAASGGEVEHVRILPDVEGPDRIVFPGDPGYNTADREREFGRVTLAHP
ncbi:MAG: NUDIX domain-containing protein [Actinomycetia bacterium]|nr:NUDIX domain-containing protein [Actinomycetes bacterium]